MWTCRHCGREVEPIATSPLDDDEGPFFVCGECEGLNRLISIGTGATDDPVRLVQPKV